MKSNRYLWLTVVIGLAALNPDAWAQEGQATKQECVSQVTRVVDRIKSDGFESVAQDIKPDGPYSWKDDGYVFCLDAEQGIMLAHPHLPPQMMNRPLMGWRDSNGKAFIKEMLELVHKDGKGWVSYMTRFQGSEKVSVKETYIEKVPGKNVIVGAGFFPANKE